MKFTLYILALLTLFAGCDDDRHIPTTGASTVTEMEQTETNQTRLAHAIPPPHITDSQERRNLVRRLELLNDPHRVSYIHLLSYDGRVVYDGAVKGKVSSLNSLLTTPAQVVTVPCPNCGQYTSNAQHVLPSPDFDGSYGENPHGIFWFTPDDTYMEWNGTYFLTDHPVRLSQEPIMTMAVNAQGEAVQR